MSKGFTFKQFHIEHERCAMKVGTDGILLGAWAPIDGKSRILDVGCGSGLISLMLAQRLTDNGNTDFFVTAIDIDKDAVQQTQSNVDNSKFKGAIEAICADFTYWQPTHKFDLIVSNPPYFNQSLLASTDQRNHARHTHAFSHKDLITHSLNMLTDDGIIALILPVKEADELTLSLNALGAELVNVVEIRTKLQKAVSRHLILLKKINNKPINKPVISNLLIYTKDSSYSRDYIELTKEFYLKM